MDTFFKTLLILLLVYFGLKILFRLAMPFLMRYIAKKASQKMKNAFRRTQYQSENNKQKEGKITIDDIPKKKSRNKKPVGDYVDYEEID
tara:strand:+ start:5488 stop:5754 length:267 start_codon:yes stop_codon:yes gene_type:complete